MRWLVLATDPWHDNPVSDVHGMPDSEIGDSLVFPVTQELQIKKPSSLAAGNWGVKIASYPLAAEVDMSLADRVDVFFQETSATDYAIAPVCCTFANDGSDFPDLPTGADAMFVQLPSEYTKGPFKIIGMGIEVINTTSELYLQGLVTSVRMNQPVDENCFAVFKPYGGGGNNLSSAAFIRRTPKNLSEALLIPGSVQWHAKEGTYSTVTMRPGKSSQISPVRPVLLNNDFSSEITTDTGCYTARQVPRMIFGEPGVSASANACIQPMNSSINMYTGLSDSTSLTLRVRFIIERFPAVSEKEILPLVTPTAPFDPLAIELYEKVVSRFPPAVMYKENPAGEWWKRVLGGIAEIAAPLVGFLPVPGSQIAGKVLEAASTGLLGSADRDKVKRKAKNAQNPARAKNSKGNLKIKPPKVPPRTTSNGYRK